jgi:hypothetical protein
MSEVHFDSEQQPQNRNNSSEETGFLIDFLIDKGLASDRSQAITYLGGIIILLVVITAIEILWGAGAITGGAEAPQAPPVEPGNI